MQQRNNRGALSQRLRFCLFTDEESFNELQEKPKKAFTMACANPLCVNLTHIALDD